MGHAPTQRLGAHVDQLDLVGRSHDLVGNGLALGDAGDALNDVVQRLEVLDVDRRDDGDARVEQLLDVLPALRVPGAGHVGVRELVDQRDLGLAREDRVDVHLLEGLAAVLDDLAGHDLEAVELGDCLRPVVGLDQADDDVGSAAFLAPAALVEHGEGLAHTRRGAEIDAQARLEPCLYSDATDKRSRSRLSSSTLTARSPRKPHCRFWVWRATAASTVAKGSDRTRATRAAWMRALAIEMSGSSPDAEAVTASTGTSASGREPVATTVRHRALVDSLQQIGVRRPEVRSPTTRVRRSRRPGGRRARLEVLRRA